MTKFLFVVTTKNMSADRSDTFLKNENRMSKVSYDWKN
jgi:hypothetical protein